MLEREQVSNGGVGVDGAGRTRVGVPVIFIFFWPRLRGVKLIVGDFFQLNHVGDRGWVRECCGDDSRETSA